MYNHEHSGTTINECCSYVCILLHGMKFFPENNISIDKLAETFEDFITVAKVDK